MDNSPTGAGRRVVMETDLDSSSSSSTVQFRSSLINIVAEIRLRRATANPPESIVRFIVVFRRRRHWNWRRTLSETDVESGHRNMRVHCIPVEVTPNFKSI